MVVCRVIVHVPAISNLTLANDVRALMCLSHLFALYASWWPYSLPYADCTIPSHKIDLSRTSSSSVYLNITGRFSFISIYIFVAKI